MVCKLLISDVISMFKVFSNKLSTHMQIKINAGTAVDGRLIFFFYHYVFDMSAFWQFYHKEDLWHDLGIYFSIVCAIYQGSRWILSFIHKYIWFECCMLGYLTMCHNEGTIYCKICMIFDRRFGLGSDIYCYWFVNQWCHSSISCYQLM